MLGGLEQFIEPIEQHHPGRVRALLREFPPPDLPISGDFERFLDLPVNPGIGSYPPQWYPYHGVLRAGESRGEHLRQ